MATVQYDPKMVKEYVSKADNYRNLARASQESGDYAAAANCYRQSFTLRNRVLGHQHPEVMNDAHNLASMLQKDKKYSQAESYLNWCLKANARTHGAGAYEFAQTREAMGKLYLEQGQYPRAINNFKQVVALNERYKGAASKNTFKAKKALAKAYLKSGDREKFEQIMESARLAYSGSNEAGEEKKAAAPTTPTTIAVQAQE